MNELRYLIIKKCGTAREFASRVGVGESMISHILHGRKKIAPHHILLFANVLGVTAEDLEVMINEEQGVV